MQKVLLFLPIFILGIACSPKNISPITKIAPDDYWEYYEMVNTAKDFRDAENYQESANTFLNAFIFFYKLLKNIEISSVKTVLRFFNNWF